MAQGFRPALAGSGPGLRRNRRAEERGAIREPPLRNGMDGTLRERTLRPVSRVGHRRRAEERPVSCAGCAVLCALGPYLFAVSADGEHSGKGVLRGGVSCGIVLE